MLGVAPVWVETRRSTRENPAHRWRSTVRPLLFCTSLSSRAGIESWAREVTNRTRRRQSDARAVTKVKRLSLVKYLTTGRQHRSGWKALVGTPQRARWPETVAGSESSARSEREAPRDLGDPRWSWSAYQADRVCRTKGIIPEKGRCHSAKSDSLVVLRARESRVHGEAAKQMKADFRETSLAPTEAGVWCQQN